MSLLRTLDRTSAVFITHARPFLAFLYPLLERSSPKRSFCKKAIKNAPPPATHSRLDTFFIQALVRAGSCPKHAKQISTLSGRDSHSVRQNRGGPKSTWRKPESRGFKRRVGGKGPLDKVKNFAEKELQALVDYYGMELDTRPDEDLPDAGSLVWNVGDDHEPWPLRDKADAVHIKKLQKLLEDDEAPHDEIFDTYKKLPSPGVVYLSIGLIRSLLHHLAIVERPTPIAMQRFLSILDDMKTAHIHIIRSEWTSAIHLAGRAMGKVGSDELQSALHIWRDMEHRAAIKGRDVTFNVLFNVAVKAGRYSLAESFMKEMQARRLPMFRYWRVTLLYYYGVLQNGNSVRKAYQELIAAGEIVDTVVLNAVIASLIRAGEPSAAEHVFERMKRLHATRISPAPGHRFLNRNWRDRRALGLLFRDESRRLVREGRDDELKRLQDFAPVAPDSRTYGILMRYYATTAGNIDRVDELLREMKLNSVPLDGTVFIVIFHGFSAFGGMRYSSWTSSKLEKFWNMYLKALDQQLERTWLSSLAVIAALKAFARCTEPERTVHAWEQIRALWKPNEAELENVMVVLRALLSQKELEGGEGRGFFDARDPG
ncbi:Pentatricopeptide repeat protein [Pyrenophora teres f. maculata]|nr:Pentatricopeptide repeat protein [Pyrenophora teres f. maculata]